MKTEEIKLEEYAARIVKLRSDILQVKNEYFYRLIVILFCPSISLIAPFYHTYNEENIRMVIIIIWTVIYLAVMSYWFRYVKTMNAIGNVVANIDSIYTKKQTLEESLGVLKEIYFVMKNMKFITEELGSVSYMEDN
jgi:cytochrome c biogenesis factor